MTAILTESPTTYGYGLDVKEKLNAYYREYYRDSLGLSDWKERIERRMDEESNCAEPVVSEVEKLLQIDLRGKKVLVVGAGTGAELFLIHARGAIATGIEPYAPALEILRAKAQAIGFSPERVVEGCAEAMPFADDFFDLVYCYTVLEHVSDVEKSLDEMARVCRNGGRIFLQTPNYSMPFEPHYRLFMPTFLPKPILKTYLLIRGRPTGFISGLTFVTQRRVLGHLRKRGLTTLVTVAPFPRRFGIRNFYMFLMRRFFGVEKDMRFIIIKDPALPGRE